jgi:hypothetical protein
LSLPVAGLVKVEALGKVEETKGKPEVITTKMIMTAKEVEVTMIMMEDRS